ncbi:MAG TPA: SRPBCC family protein [Actinomycetota bacterium]|nr:SRPBCC family protein [Actinomycetota bacterium]
MSRQQPITTFRARVATSASPDVVYRSLADLGTHLIWAGDQSRQKTFRLLSLEAPGREATVGDHFSSTGSNILSMQFADHSVVVEAEPGQRFGFDTESRLARKHRPTLETRFRHRYLLAPTPGGTSISYACEVWPQNYLPWWLRWGQRPMTKLMAQRSIRRNMKNLARLAESVPAQP